MQRTGKPVQYLRICGVVPIAKNNSQSPFGKNQRDRAEQILITLHRFALSSLWFALSIGGRDSEEWLRCTITDAQEVIQDEIWVVTVQSSDRHAATQVRSFYVLEETCEVIGRPNPAATSSSVLALRSDWSGYIQARLTNASTQLGFGPSLLRNMKWAHYEEYERGISRLWLKRLDKEGDLGQMKRVVAERYTLACIMANRYATFRTGS